MAYKKKFPLWLTVLGKHWFAAVLCFILSMCLLVSFGTRLGRVITQFCSLAIYYAMLYSAVRDYGENDKNKYLENKGKKDLFKGLKCGMLACLPNILGSFALVILKVMSVEPGWYLVVYRMLINPFYMPINLTLLQPSLSMLEIPLTNVLLSASLSLVAPLVVALSYVIGFGEFTVAQLVMYKNEIKQ